MDHRKVEQCIEPLHEQLMILRGCEAGWTALVYVIPR
jgi:hypothetical protein